MEWTDDAIVLAARPHGEGGLVVQLLTAEHGRHAGLVRGGASKRQRPVYQPGNGVRATWRGRLAEHLGTVKAELVTGRAGHWIADPLRLAGIAAACAVAEAALPERAPAPAVYRGLLALLEALEREDWGEAYVAWEIALLGELGFGLDLERCAATGRNDRLAWVSPKSGRAVSLSAGAPYAEKLLRLPDFLNGGADVAAGTATGAGPAAASWPDIADGLKLSGHFLERHVFAPHDRQLPPARRRFAERVERAGAE
ncbi:MAG: DNA repair protein RecO [Rhodospirillaceae bacterium]|nr:DNA repair protein RecO [Rhodospirillaceae bacterium]MYB13618.1 DNA repair protein RecO [Rhodospirillaceae bacterium]MYI48643.1 DNA repair protein RecO [Rhodospirillaceae bacterium]